MLRDRNVLYRVNYLDEIENSYRLNVTNKSQQEREYQINVNGIDNLRNSVQGTVKVAPGEMLTVPMTLTSERSNLSQKVTDVELVITALDDNEVTLIKETRFYSN